MDITVLNSRQRGASRKGLLIALAIGLAVAIPLAIFGWKIAYRKYFEPNNPSIIVAQPVTGIGTEPKTLSLRISDPQSGLQKILIRYQQDAKTPPKEFIKRTLSGEKEFTIDVTLDHKALELHEGPLVLSIKAIDRSLWSNTTEQRLALTVDFKPPKLAAFTTMHNERRGGSELIFYRATDTNLGNSGVVIGDKRYIGIPARFFSPHLTDAALFGTLYALPLEQHSPATGLPKLFAQDAGNNEVIKPFPQKLFDRRINKVSVTVSKEFIYKRAMGKFLREGEDSNEALSKALQALQEDDALISKKLSDTRLDKIHHGALQLPGGAVQTSFADELSFSLADNNSPTTLRQLLSGMELKFSAQAPTVYAAGDGFVLSSEALPGYGRVLIVDHGFGLSTVYGRLSEASVTVGQKVTKGMPLGVAGTSGFARIDSPQCYFEVRVQGTPVDPREWIDEAWVYGHITKQGLDAEKTHEIYFGEE